MGTLERCHGERRHFHGHTHAGRKWCQMTYFRTPGPPRAKLKGGPVYEAKSTLILSCMSSHINWGTCAPVWHIPAPYFRSIPILENIVISSASCSKFLSFSYFRLISHCNTVLPSLFTRLINTFSKALWKINSKWQVHGKSSLVAWSLSWPSQSRAQPQLSRDN